jgi:hypothetical protein
MSLFTISGLRTEAQRLGVLSESFYAHELKKSVDESPLSQKFHIFMAHSILDAEIIHALKNEILNMGYSVYIDWDVDGQLDRSKVDKETAQLIRFRMQNCSCLFFATSDNSPHSKWMPWELGYFDALKRRVAILPVPNYLPADPNFYNGQEYLGLYPYVATELDTNNVQQLWILESPSKYTLLDIWLQGNEPQEHR